jgi:hypothetical protein
MKSLPKHCAATTPHKSSRFIQRTIIGSLGSAVLASLVLAGSAFGQGAYYPVYGTPYPPTAANPTVYGGNYFGINSHSNINLQYLQSVLQGLYGPAVTLQVPVPTVPAGSRPPLPAEYSATVKAATNGVLAATAPSGVTLASLSNEAVGWNIASRGPTATAIAQAIVQYNTTAPTYAATTLSNLTTVVDALSLSQPTNIDTILPSILAQAGTVASVASGIPQLVAAAVSDISGDLTRVSSLVSSGVTSIGQSVLPAGTGANTKTDTFTGSTGLVNAVLSSTAANNNPLLIATVAKAITSTAFVGAGGLDTLSNVITSAVNGLGTKSNDTVAAVADGALGSQGTTSAGLVGGSIQLALSSANSATANYTNTVISGYNATSGTFAGIAAASGGTLADAAANGAALKGTIAIGTVAQQALIAANSNSAVTPATPALNENILAELLYVSPGFWSQAITGSVNASHVPYGNATFGQIAYGVASAIQTVNLGSAVSTILGTSASSLTTLTTANVKDVVDQAIRGASAGNDSNGYSVIVYSAMNTARNTPTYLAPITVTSSATNSHTVQVSSLPADFQVGYVMLGQTVTAINTVTMTITLGGNANANISVSSSVNYTGSIGAILTRQAIDSLSAVGGPSYLAPVAAAAGDTFGYFRSAIQIAAFGSGGAAGGGQLQADSGDYVAAQNGTALVQALQVGTTTRYASTVTAFSTAQALAPGSGVGQATNSVVADLYGAVLADSTDYASELAAAIKQTTVSDTALTQVTLNALNSSATVANVQMVDSVAQYLKTEAITTGIGDIFDYVGHQIILNPALTQSIVTAATVVDPDHAHFIAHSVAFNNPANVAASVGSIFSVAQITSLHPVSAPTAGAQTGLVLNAKPGGIPGPTAGTIVDQPAAAAAITAGLTTGIIEANVAPLPSDPNYATKFAAYQTTVKNELVATVTQAVAASISQQGVSLLAPLHPFYNSSLAGDNGRIFAQSDGSTATPNLTTGVGLVSNYQVTGPAGAITGYVAQAVNQGDTTISDITKAVLAAATGGQVRYYAKEIAQAAAQALRWVGGASVSTELTTIPIVVGTINAAYVGNPAYDIAMAIAPTVSGFSNLAQLENAALFGISQAANGVIGAGALGLNASGINPGTGTLQVKSSGNNNTDIDPATGLYYFYAHRSATGTPVTDIFNL